MADDDWYRSDRWDDEARQLFEDRIARARSSRSQYLKIKALSLAAASDPRRRDAARDLFERLMREHPDDELQIAGAHSGLGDLYADEGRPDDAEAHLRACLALEKTANYSHNTELRLAELLAAYRPRETADEIENLLATVLADPVFQVVTWRALVARVKLREALVDAQGAGEAARSALALLDDNRPRFSRHPTVGLIHPDRKTLRHLRRAAKR